MKKTFLLILFSLILFQGKGKEIFLADFGIKPGVHNNTEGFIKLSNFIQGKSDITINFKKGTYIVGKQESSNSKVAESMNQIFRIENCSNIKINGNGAIIKYENNLMFGTFDIKTKNALNHKAPFFNKDNAAFPGNFLLIINSKNIALSKLTLDGNINNSKIGGSFGDKGIQLAHRGIAIVNSYTINLNNLFIHHFGLDGIEVRNEIKLLGLNKKYQVEINYTKCYYNGRQGISWTGGNGLYISNSEFSLTGKGNISSSPGAGIDIEPEIGICQNGLFENCKFENNVGPGLISDFSTIYTDNITFNKCYFGGTTNSAILARNAGINIKNSILIGQILSPSSPLSDKKLIFDSCLFYDYNPNNNSKLNPFLYYIDAGGFQKSYEIKNSTFNLKHTKFCYIESGVSEINKMPKFRNNTINISSNNFSKTDFFAFIKGCILENNTFNIKTNNPEITGLYISTGGTMKFLGKNIIISPVTKAGWNNPNGPKTINEN